MAKFPAVNRTQNFTVHARTEVPAMVGMTAVDNCRQPTSVFPSGSLRNRLSVAKVIMGKGYHYQHLREQNSWKKKNNKKKHITRRRYGGYTFTGFIGVEAGLSLRTCF